MRAQYSDLRDAPVAHWRLDGSLADDSGNALALSVETGTERYAEIVPGLRGFYFDGSTNLYRAAYDAVLAITGDITIEWTSALSAASAFTSLLGFGGNGETEITNMLWRVAYSSGGSTTLEHEHSAGTNDTHSVPHVIANHAVTRLAARRQSNQWSLWINGRQAGSTSAGLSAATGGSSGALRFGYDNGGVGNRVIGTVADLQVVGRAKSDAELLMAYNRTLGPVFGAL